MNSFQDTLKKYLDIFAGQEMYFVNDTRNLALFQKNPQNTNADDIRTKISAIRDDPGLQQLGNTDELVSHILSLKIDDRLMRGDLTVVEDIAHATIQGKPTYLLHFASVYCNYHRPEVFPIYSDQYLAFYKRYIVEHKLPLKPEGLNTYDLYTKALNDLVARLGLKGKMNYLQLRKFAWLYAEKVLAESNGS
ncbi:MAG: hypothetical protein JNJ65_09565 [Cyclobacteriaceae bacterium]|nr:hypothetical protein [Cyclobacteriaceae bacterium]